MSALTSQLDGKAVAKDVPVPAAGEKVVLGPVDVQRFDRFTIYLEIAPGPLGLATTCKLQTGPTSTGPWYTVDHAIAAPNIEPGTTESKSYWGKSFKFVQVVSSPDTQLSVYLSAGGLE